MLLAMIFGMLRQRLSIFPCTETRMKITEGRFVIPDIAVFWPNEPPRVPDQPPLIAIEVLSPDDKMTEVRRKLEEYRAWGVAHVWLVDPHTRSMYTCQAGLTEVEVLRVPELAIEVTAREVFE
jgi:Uma2 family endonuclease